MNLYTRKLKTILQSRYLFKVLAILFLIYALLFTNFYEYRSIYNTSDTKIRGLIVKYVTSYDKITIYIDAKELLIGTYYYGSDYEKEYILKNYKLGDTVLLTGTLKRPINNTVPNAFNYRKYLYYNKIFYTMDVSNIKKLSNNTSVLYYIKNKIKNRISSIDSVGYLNIFILGDKSLIDKDILDIYRANGVSHLFSISGMHISLLASFILCILKKVSYNNRLNYFIVISFLLFYLFLADSSPSILRATILFVLFAINRCYNLKIKNVDIALIVFLLMIIINPFFIYNIGFQYSYLISFTLILYQDKINSINGRFFKCLYVSFMCFIVSLPISIYNFSQVNFISIIINIFLIPFVSIIIYPLSLISFAFPIFFSVYLFFINILEVINIYISDINIFNFVLCRVNVFILLIYYIIIYLSLFNYKYLFILFLMLLFHKNYLFFDSKLLITILDVGQGDSIFVKFPNGKDNILIDTGGVVTYNNKNTFSIIDNKTVPFLKSLGISDLSYLVLTHGDYDHMGEAINLVNNFKVEKVIFNCGEYNDLEKELIKVLDKKKIKYYSCIKELNIDKNKLYFLQTKEYDNENDNSNVIYTELDGYKFMFMGDASVTTEKEILNNYNLPDIDVFKVGHHGSRTSSSIEFINEISPKYSVISVGKNNRYGHPNKEVLNILDDSKIYRTDENGSIIFKIKNNKLKIETCSP